MYTIFYKEAKLIILGSSILSCGGGLSYKDQMSCLDSLYIKRGIKVIQLNELASLPSDLVYVTASELGPADKPPINKAKIPEMIKLFSKRTGKKIGGILPVEVGQEAIAFDAALQSGLPIINSDLAGLRAVPKATLNGLKMQNVPFTRSPLVVLTATGKVSYIDKNTTLEEDEKQLRQIAEDTKDVIFIVGGLITSKMILKYLNHSSLTITSQIGKSIDSGENFTKKVPLHLVYSTNGKIKKIMKINEVGFSEKQVYIETSFKEDNLCTLTIKNEYMKIVGNNIKFQFPQLITLFSNEKKRDLSASDLEEGMLVEINIFDPLPFWSNYYSNNNLYE